MNITKLNQRNMHFLCVDSRKFHPMMEGPGVERLFACSLRAGVQKDLLRQATYRSALWEFPLTLLAANLRLLTTAPITCLSILTPIT